METLLDKIMSKKTTPLTRLGETFDQYQRAMASTTRILDLLDTPKKIVSDIRRLDTGSIEGEI